MDLKQIKSFILSHIEGSGIFLVDIELKPGNLVQVYVDKKEGITIEECVKLSREFNASFDRDDEDYELQVSSPGLDMPFKVDQQFEKYIDSEVHVIMNDGSKIKARLLSFSKEELNLSITKKVKEEGRKRKKLLTEEETIKRSDIKAVKAVISFK